MIRCKSCDAHHPTSGVTPLPQSFKGALALSSPLLVLQAVKLHSRHIPCCMPHGVLRLLQSFCSRTTVLPRLAYGCCIECSMLAIPALASAVFNMRVRLPSMLNG